MPLARLEHPKDGRADLVLAHPERRNATSIGLLEEAWQRISTNGAVAYGLADIQRATEEGAVETLLIGAVGADAGTWSSIAVKVETFSGKVVQCSVDHDAGEQLMGFGGAVALLRYKV